MNEQVRKNCYYEKKLIEEIKKVAKHMFGHEARWSQSVNYLVWKGLEVAVKEIDQKEETHLKTAQIALNTQRKRNTANQLGEIYKENLEELLA
jgi:hypothetical protein